MIFFLFFIDFPINRQSGEFLLVKIDFGRRLRSLVKEINAIRMILFM
tara:strand:- start:2019 stop:2159 length:141 start_codon:yes stop_codon:yes gene_type:complete